MKDLISRQAVIDAVEESRRLNHHQDGKEACAHEYEHRHFLKILRDLPPAQPEQRWIPCSERLPEDDEIVLVSDGIDYAVAFWRPDADAWDDPLHGWLDSFEFDVKAWMPLPDPYRGERDENRR